MDMDDTAKFVTKPDLFKGIFVTSVCGTSAMLSSTNLISS